MSMIALSTGEINQMRDTLNVTLPGTAILYSRSGATDGMGGQTETYTAYGTVDARLSPIGSGRSSGWEMEIVGRLGLVNPMTLTIPAEQTITETGRVSYRGTTYEIAHVAHREPWEISRRVLVVEVA